MSDEYKHCTVLLAEAVEALQIQPQGIYIDATFGRGGHAEAILAKLGPEGRLIVIDKDPAALAVAEAIAKRDTRLQFVAGSFAELETIAAELGVSGQVNGILFDLGVSSPQLDDASRGFSFKNDGPLDMRMDPNQGESAADWLAKASERDIANVLFRYGEEKLSRRIARKICEERQQHPLETTQQLATLIASCYPKRKGPPERIHPATRSFQGIRIFINNELDDVQKGLQGSVAIMAPQARLVVISFHSLEDRIVKRFIRDEERGPQLPRDIPVTAAMQRSRLKRVGKLLLPGEDEINHNPRSRSAKCRVAERTDCE